MRPRSIIALTALVSACCATDALAAPPPTVQQDRLKLGYWWYAPDPEPAEPAPNEVLAKPVIPPSAELARLSPPQIRKLIEQQRDYAATVLSVDAVADFW